MSAKSQAQGSTQGTKTWSSSTLAKWAVIMAIVFGAIVIVYPMMFNPVDQNPSTTEPALPPAAVPVVPAQPVAPGN